MKDTPEIAPEIRGLLEEIVADPRSAIRLAPRHALRSWFDSGETVRTSAASATRAERHLLEAHREALARLLYEASRIAYWKGPAPSLRPVGSDGNPYDPAGEESFLLSRIQKRVLVSEDESDGVALLRSCLVGVAPGLGRALATASLSLAPRDDARLCLACHIMLEQPRSALALLERTAIRATSPRVRGLAWAEVGTRRVLLDRLEDGKSAYTESQCDWPHAWFSLFNLSCVMGLEEEATACSVELDLIARPESATVSGACALIAGWARTRPRHEIQRARDTVNQIGDRLSETARRIGMAYD